MKKYDEELRKKTGRSMLEIAKEAVRADASVERILRKAKAAVVPVTAGKGVIKGFPEAVAAILRHVGVNAVITQGTDIVGMAEAFEQGADLIFAADDRKFVAINLHTRRVVDNAAATAKAYVAALDRMAKGLRGKLVLVIGIGNVGYEAVSNLITRKAKPLAVDIDRHKLLDLRKRYKDQVTVFHTAADAIRHTNLVINTAPARNMLKAGMIRKGMLISAPAIPVGLTNAALKKMSSRNLVHDPLQLGVATMVVEACAN